MALRRSSGPSPTVTSMSNIAGAPEAGEDLAAEAGVGVGLVPADVLDGFVERQVDLGAVAPHRPRRAAGRRPEQGGGEILGAAVGPTGLRPEAGLVVAARLDEGQVLTVGDG